MAEAEPQNAQQPSAGIARVCASWGGQKQPQSQAPTALSEEDRQNRLVGERYQKDAFEADASVKLFALEVDAGSGRLLRRIDLADVKDPQVHAANCTGPVCSLFVPSGAPREEEVGLTALTVHCDGQAPGNAGRGKTRADGA